LFVQRNIPVTFTKPAVSVINDTIDPQATPQVLKAIPAHSPARSASTPAPVKKTHPTPTPSEIRKAVPLEPFNKKEKRNGE
jgi:hypothetical protein